MAKVTPGKNAPGRGKSLRGRVVFRTTRGVLVAQKWPRPRGQPKTEQHRQQVEWFRQAQQLAKRADPKTQATIMRAVHRSPLMPRDLATSLMAGRTYSPAYGPHNVLRSLRAMSEVSKSLDIISDAPGATLVRGTEYWLGQPLPSEGSVWLNPNPTTSWTGTASASNFAWKGRAFTPQVPITITAIGAIVVLSATEEYLAAVATLDTSERILTLHFSPPQSPGRAGREFLAFPVTVPLQPGERAAILAGRIDGSGTSPIVIGPDDGAQLAIPASTQKWVRANTLDLVPGVILGAGVGPATNVFPRGIF